MILVSVAIFAMVGRSDAAVVLSADMDPDTPGIQSQIRANIGDQITVDFVFELSGSSTLSAWQYSIRFNTENLAFVSRQETAPDGFGFIESDPQIVDDLAGGLLFRFGHDSGGGPDAAFGPFRVGAVTFDVIGTSVSPLGFDVSPGFFESGLDTFLANTSFADIPLPEITFNSGSITAVPEPSSMTLLGLVGIVSTRHLRRRLMTFKNRA